MSGILLTQNTTFIIGPVAQILGYIMNGIFYVLNMIGIPNIGLSIIFFTIVIYLLMTPLTYKQQKFSKLQQKMSPELQAIQAKYKGKTDNDSRMALNMETQAVYAKYGVSPTGSCLQLLIQMPILFALYRVIYAIPAYVGQVKEAFFPLVDNLIQVKGSDVFIQKFTNAAMYASQFTDESYKAGALTEFVRNTYIDVLNKASTADWVSLKAQYATLAGDVDKTTGLLNGYNNFLGLNIGDSPWATMMDGFQNGAYIIAIAAILIPVLSAVTQWINIKLVPQAKGGNPQADQMAKSMKTMNMLMPLMSAWFCFTLPAGMGIYWIAGAVIRGIQQVVINKRIDKMDFEQLIEKNKAKSSKKMEEQKKKMEQMQQYAAMNTRKLNPAKTSSMTEEEREELLKAAESRYANAKPGSLAAKANLVRDYNEKNSRK